MLKKISISSSSFLLSKHPSWRKLEKNFKLDFKYIGNFSQHFLDETEDKVILSILFIEDLYDVSQTNVYTKSKIQAIIDLIIKKRSMTQNPIIIGLCGVHHHNTIESIFKTSPILKFHENLLNKLKILQKKYPNIYVLNLDYSLAYHGTKEAFDNRNWYLVNCRLSSRGLEIIINDIARVLTKLTSVTKKILVLDCDNTLWGGVVGEEGIKSIQLGQDGIGKAFSDFQRKIKNLSNNGTLIAIVSKNNEEDVMDVFKNHDGMLLKNKDIVNFKINWKEKSKNIKMISEELNISLDSFAFWDDNPLERDKVRKFLPDVMTIEPDANVTEWVNQLNSMIEFSNFKVTKEDTKKINQYKIRSKFLSEKKFFNDEKKYLKSIKLRAKSHKLSVGNLSRAMQMTQKTNQFNLRSKRYTENELNSFQKSKKNIIFVVSLKDIYGDHGNIGLVIAKHFSKKTLLLDTFLISCRVLGRNLESWMLKELKRKAIELKYEDIFAEFIQNKKNILVKSFLPNHNFKKIKNIPNLKKTNNITQYYSKLADIDDIKADVYD